MKTFKHILAPGVFMLLAILVTVSCIDGNDWDTDTSSARLFKVTSKSISVTPAALTASVTWNTTPEAEYYIIEVSTSPLTDDIEMGTGSNLVFGQDQSIKTPPCVLQGLQSETEYYLRIKARGNGKESYWSYPTTSTFTTTDEQILEEVADDDISGTSIHISWNAAGWPVTHLTYQKEGEADVTRRDITSEEIAANAATITGLELGTKYTIYLYNEEKLRGLVEATTEQIMNAVNDEDCESESVRVTWNANGKPVDHLTYLRLGESEPKSQILTQEEINNGSAVIEGLRPFTSYTIRIYNGDSLRGETQVTTLMGAQVESTVENITSSSATIIWDAQEIGTITGYTLVKGTEMPTEEQTALTENTGRLELTNLDVNTTYSLVIFYDGIARSSCTFTTLRGIPGDYTQITINSRDEWGTKLENANGKVAIIIPKGVTIDMSGNTSFRTEIPEAITSLLIWGGDEGIEYLEDEKPTFGTRGLSFTGNKTEVQFFNLNIQSNGTSNYIIRQRGNGTIGSLMFESCNIRNAAGIFCARDNDASGGICQTIVMDDCIIAGIGNYSVIYAYNGYTVNGISFTNSTINGVTGNIFRIEQSATYSLTISQSTFYNSPQAIIRSGASSADIQISNTLISAVNTSTTPSQDSVTGSNVITTSDCYFVSWATRTQLTSDQLFADPANGNFKVIASEYADYGDPRWNE